MTVSPEYRPERDADVFEMDMGDGVILYHRDLVHHLNQTAGVVWHLCDGEGTVGQLAEEIADGFGVDVARVRSEVTDLIAEFDRLGLVKDASG